MAGPTKHATYSGEGPADGSGKDVKQTSQLAGGARETYATGKSDQNRRVTKHKPWGKLGDKGHPE